MCYHICPTNAIKMEEKDGKRTIWGREFELIKCSTCETPYTTKEMIQYRKELLKDIKLPEDFFTKCPKCYDLTAKDEKIDIDTKYTVEVLKNICKDCHRCVEACPKEPKGIKVEWEKNAFIMNIESTGGLPPERILQEATKILDKQLKEFQEKLIVESP